MTRYEIRTGKTAPCELWFVVEADFGSAAESFVCSGTYNYYKNDKEDG